MARLCLLVSTLLLLCLAAALPAAARSAFVLPRPVLESIPAGTYDDRGRRLGDAALFWKKLPDGTIHMRAVTKVSSGARNVINSWFEEIDDGRALRVLREESLSYDDRGDRMVLVEVDHEKRRASCTPPPGSDARYESLELDAEDRVANTTMSLLFQPLIHGEVERVEFQAFLCRGGARLMNFVALPGKPSADGRVVEVRFGPNLGKVASWFASVVVPKLRFWFDADSGQYLAHRMPLYGGGPEVVVSREGVSAGFSQR
jgi:hypothetical protein